MSTDAQKRLKALRETIEWADDMMAAGSTAGDVDIEGIVTECAEALEARRGDVLCPVRDIVGRRCMLSKEHRTNPSRLGSPHEFDKRGTTP